MPAMGDQGNKGGFRPLFCASQRNPRSGFSCSAAGMQQNPPARTTWTGPGL